MATVKLTNVKKVYANGVVAVSDFNLDIEDKEFVVFVGPSGCGKSTTLRMIAGLEDITEGTIEIDDEVVNDLQPKDRHIAMVFQNYALYPHLTVFENMAFSLRLRHVKQDEVYERVTQAAKILGITDLLMRKPRALSGGQRQRVAIGRAMVRDSKVFLMDEPLSNLDAKLRASMRTELSKLHIRLQTTFIYVTHDQVEAMTLGTRIVVMKDGFIKQIDTPQNLYDFPANRFVASFIGTPQMNFYNGTLGSDGTLEFANGQLIRLSQQKMATLDQARIKHGMKVILGIRPEDFSIDPDGVEGVTCRADVLEELGSECLLYGRLDLDNDAVIVEEEDTLALTAKIEARTDIKRGSIIHLAVNTDRVHLFDSETQISLLAKYSHLFKPTN